MEVAIKGYRVNIVQLLKSGAWTREDTNEQNETVLAAYNMFGNFSSEYKNRIDVKFSTYLYIILV